jgi:5-methylcytosine-specific restriction endonuclease McrA
MVTEENNPHVMRFTTPQTTAGISKVEQMTMGILIDSADYGSFTWDTPDHSTTSIGVRTVIKDTDYKEKFPSTPITIGNRINLADGTQPRYCPCHECTIHFRKNPQCKHPQHSYTSPFAIQIGPPEPKVSPRGLCLACRAEKKRKPISTGTRFDILNRDGFRCKYCGRTAEEDNVKLHVDHIVPVSAGGKNTESNLATSCQECNMGKGNKIISTA